MGVRNLFDLSGKTAIVTGGSRGIGLQMAAALGEMGAQVAITASKPDELDEERVPISKASAFNAWRSRPISRISRRSRASSMRC